MVVERNGVCAPEAIFSQANNMLDRAGVGIIGETGFQVLRMYAELRQKVFCATDQVLLGVVMDLCGVDEGLNCLIGYYENIPEINRAVVDLRFGNVGEGFVPEKRK